MLNERGIGEGHPSRRVWPYRRTRIFSDPIRLPLISVNTKRGGGSNYDNVADGVQVVCAIAPLKETSHSVVLSADVVADLECMPALSIMCV